MRLRAGASGHVRRTPLRMPTAWSSIAAASIRSTASLVAPVAPYAAPRSRVGGNLQAYQNRNKSKKKFQILKYDYSRIALILLTPALEDSSLVILNFPNPPVRSTCGPPQISQETIPSLSRVTSSLPASSPII